MSSSNKDSNAFTEPDSPDLSGNFEESKRFGNEAYPVEASITSNLLRRTESILTPEMLISRYLKGFEDEINAKYSSEELKQEIELAINEFETWTGVPFYKTQYRERLPFDRQAYRAFVYFKLNNGPILTIEEVLIESSNGENIYKLPADWIEMGLAHKRQINLIPILSIFGAAGLKDGQASNAGLVFIQAVNNFRWMPAFYTVKYTCGISHTEGKAPIIANHIIGMTAAVEILGSLQANIKYSSTSISQDGISQSASGPGPETYEPRIKHLTEKRDKYIEKLRSEFHQKYFMSNI